jgi:hypothetical protein
MLERSAEDAWRFSQSGLIFAFYSPMLGLVPAVRACRVSFTDPEGITHSASVTAASLYEAAALGVAEFRRCLLMDVAPGPATRLTVAIQSPSTVHEIPMRKLTAWLEGGGKSPNEQAVKVMLREMLGNG